MLMDPSIARALPIKAVVMLPSMSTPLFLADYGFNLNVPPLYASVFVALTLIFLLKP